METEYRLHYAPDNASLVIRLALDKLSLPYETALVDRQVRAQKSPAYLRLNPNGLIPVLETPDGPMFETAAILLWLADRHGGLAPAYDSGARAAFLKWLFFVSNTIHPALRMVFYPELYAGPDVDTQSALRRHMRGELSCHLDKLESLIREEHFWFGGATPSGLDFYVACTLRWMALYPRGDTDWFDIGNWPLLRDMAVSVESCQSAGAAIQAEGLGPNPFSAPQFVKPPEGSAT